MVGIGDTIIKDEYGTIYLINILPLIHVRPIDVSYRGTEYIENGKGIVIIIDSLRIWNSRWSILSHYFFSVYSKKDKHIHTANSNGKITVEIRYKNIYLIK